MKNNIFLLMLILIFISCKEKNKKLRVVQEIISINQDSIKKLEYENYLKFSQKQALYELSQNNYFLYSDSLLKFKNKLKEKGIYVVKVPFFDGVVHDSLVLDKIKHILPRYKFDSLFIQPVSGSNMNDLNLYDLNYSESNLIFASYFLENKEKYSHFIKDTGVFIFALFQFDIDKNGRKNNLKQLVNLDKDLNKIIIKLFKEMPGYWTDKKQLPIKDIYYIAILNHPKGLKGFINIF